MKLTIDRGELLNALGHVQNVVERRNTIPILSNILLTTAGDELHLTATDLDMQAVDAAEAHIEQEGALTTPAQTLFDVVRKLPDGAEVHLSFQPDNQRLMIRSGRAQFELPTLPAADFQPMSPDEDAASFTIPAADLKRLIDKTRFAISTEETRYYLNGVYLHVADGDEGKLLRAVATDGHRLALSELEMPKGADAMAGVIIPRKAIAEVRRLIDNINGDVEIAASKTKIVFRCGRAVLTTKLIDGSFPDYARVIPQGNERFLTIDNKSFEQAVDRVSTVSAERSRSVKMSITSDYLTLSVNHSETGHGVEEVESEYESEPLEIGFNARYLLDIAQQIEGDQAVFAFNDSASPALVKDPKDPHSKYVLMPLRV